MSDATRHPLEKIPPSEIFEDLARFQSRAAYPRDWMDKDLDDVELYNSGFASVISVWRDPDDAKLYVIDGHRRLRLAKRVQSPVVLVQFLEASTDADAFAKGVELNWPNGRSNGEISCVGRWKVAVRRLSVRYTRGGLMRTASRQIDCTSFTQTWGGAILPSQRIIKRRKQHNGYHE